MTFLQGANFGKIKASNITIEYNLKVKAIID
jgi:hypothetical protein